MELLKEEYHNSILQYDELMEWYGLNREKFTQYENRWLGFYDLNRFVVTDSEKEAQIEAVRLLPEGRFAVYAVHVGHESDPRPLLFHSAAYGDYC